MSTHAPTPNDVQYIRRATLIKRWDCSDMTVTRMVRRGELPPPTRLGKGMSAWRSDIIEAIEAARTPPGPEPTTKAASPVRDDSRRGPAA